MRSQLSIFLASAVIVFGAFSAMAQTAPKIADAKPGDIRVFVSGALRAPFEAVRAEAQTRLGRTIVTQAGMSRELQKDIDSGQPFEVALLTREVVDDMIAKGAMVPGSRTDLAKVVVGVSERGSAPKLDVSTPEALKKALLGAKAIRRFYGVGASVPTVDNLFAKLGVTDALKDKVIPLGTGQRTPDVVLKPGEYELIVNLVSEIIPMNGWTYLGTIPDQFQIPVFLSAGVGAKGDAKAAQALIEFLKGDSFAAAMQANGMTRPTANSQ